MIQARPSGETLVLRAGAAFERYQHDERAALDELVEMLTPLLWRTCRGAGLDAVTTEDVMQTVWMSLLRSADTVRDPHTIVKWLLTSARREAWRASRRSRDDRDRSGAVFGVDNEEVMDVPDQDDGPEQAVFRDDRQRQLWKHVRALPERCRQLVGVIAFADKPDYAHLAESLGMPVGSIGPTRGRCLAKLRDLLAGDPHWEGQL
jgi:RNA polymerase sigma factor (sigma-70 family)